MNHDKIEERFDNKNREYFFQDLFNGSSRERGAIAKEVIRLCDIVTSDYKPYFIDILETLRQYAHRHLSGDPQPLNDVYDSIKAKHLLTAESYIVKAFLSVQMQRVSYKIERYDQYKALTLVVVTHLSFKGEHNSKIQRLCNELRQYALGNRDQLAAYLPDILKLNFEILIDELVELEALDTIQHSRVKNQISNIRVPFRDSYENRAGFTRNIQTREFKKDGHLQIKTSETLDDEHNESVIEIKELTFTTKSNEKGQIWEEEEELSTTKRSLSLVSAHYFAKSDQVTHLLKAKAINERIRKKRMYLSCDIYRMTPFELRLLVTHCIASHKQSNTASECAAALLLMLILGNSFDEINQATFKKRNGHLIGIKRKFFLPTHKLREELQPMLRHVQSEYVLPLPLNLIGQLKKLQFKGITNNDLKQYLSDINKDYNTHLTLSKISAYLTQTLQAYGIDYSLIDLITGYDPNNQPLRFYTYIPQVLSVFRRYLSHIDNASNEEYLADIVSNIDEPPLGSPLYIKFKDVNFLFDNMNEDIQKFIENSSSHFSEKIHNLIVLRLQIVLSLVSGYRPVEGWFGYIQDIHFPTGEYRIAEKERQFNYSGRVILLPPTALRMLNEYLTYCEEATIYYSDTHPELHQRYRQTLDNEMPFCFYRYQEKIQEVTPSIFAQHIDPICPLPVNWGRHYLRSFLFEQNISDELISAWMGHIHSNQLPFAQFSQLSRSELQTIQKLLETHLCQLFSGKTS